MKQCVLLTSGALKVQHDAVCITDQGSFEGAA